jgi:hypothetical protein
MVVLDPENYRPITLLCCIGKNVTSILNNRLNVYFEQFTILNESQTGFRHSYSATDHMVSLYALLELLCVKKEKLQCAFIDFEKAFAFDQRNSLLFKLINNNIHGNFYRIVENMYSDAKSRIVHNNKKSDMFACVIGVRDRPFNLKGGGVWFFVSFRIFYSDNTRVRIFNFFVAQSANFFSGI